MTVLYHYLLAHDMLLLLWQFVGTPSKNARSLLRYNNRDPSGIISSYLKKVFEKAETRLEEEPPTH